MNTLSYQTPQPVHRRALIIFWLTIATSVMFFLGLASGFVLTAAILWQLVLRGDCSPKSFICKSDPFVAAPAQITDSAGNNYDNFQSGHQLSYSIAYPWKSDGTLGNWWKCTVDASLPIASDMAPE